MIELSRVSKQYGKAEILKDITLTVEDCSIYGLIGYNGAGKTAYNSVSFGEILPSYLCSGRVFAYHRASLRNHLHQTCVPRGICAVNTASKHGNGISNIGYKAEENEHLRGDDSAQQTLRRGRKLR